MSRARDGDGAGDGAGDGDGADDVAGDGTTAIAAPAAAEAPLRPGWKAVVADDRRTYYWCVATGETSWERPTATARGSADDGAWEHDLFAADDDEEALPAAGTAVLAQYSSHSAWRPARAHGAAAGGVGLRVIFDGYGDVVDVGLRWHLPGRGGRADGRERPGKRGGSWDDGGAGDDDDERRMLAECRAVRAKVDERDATGADRGRALLEKMGWKAGDGLGAASSGATRAVAETMQAQTDRRGLGSKPRGAR